MTRISWIDIQDREIYIRGSPILGGGVVMKAVGQRVWISSNVISEEFEEPRRLTN